MTVRSWWGIFPPGSAVFASYACAMYWYMLIGLGFTGFVLACLVCVSVVKDDRREAIAPRPMFLVNLLAIAVLVVIAVRFGDWLGRKITIETYSNVPRLSAR